MEIGRMIRNRIDRNFANEAFDRIWPSAAHLTEAGWASTVGWSSAPWAGSTKTVDCGYGMNDAMTFMRRSCPSDVR